MAAKIKCWMTAGVLIFGFGATTAAQVSSQDSLALVALYNSTDGPNWDNKENWLTTPVSTWYGITVTSNQVTRVIIPNNNLTGQVPVELGDLSNLTYLELGGNNFSGSIPPELGNLSNLIRLAFGNDDLSGEIPPELGNLTSLQDLWLFNSSLSGSIPVELANLSNLESLFLQQQDLTGEIPKELGNLTNLADLRLNHNGLTGSIPIEITSLANLSTLNLGTNQLTGEIPPEIGNLTTLTELDLSSNDFTGGIPVELANLSNLIRLVLAGNQLSGTIPVELFNLTNLTVLWLHGNQLTGSIPPEIGNLANLEFLALGTNSLTGVLPPELGNLSNLRSLSITDTGLEGYIPPELGNLVSLESLSLLRNNFSGSIPVELTQLSNLRTLWAGGNSLTGSIPPEIGNMASLDYIILRDNELSGSLPQELGNLSNLRNLLLNTNQFSGEIPVEIGNLTELRDLRLSENELTGSIPSELGNLSELSFLTLYANQLSGEIPVSLGSLTNLEHFSLTNNALTGDAPAELAQLNSLTRLELSNNDITSIPDFSGISSLTDILRIEGMKLTFDDIIPNLSVPASISYEPQRPFGQPDTIPAALGDTVELVPETTHLDNVYQWYKDSTMISGANSKKLIIDGVSSSDYGSYHVQVTNPNASDLTIQSEPYVLEGLPYAAQSNYTGGWNLVSLPFDVEDKSVAAHFSEADPSKFYSFDGTYNEEEILLPPGNGHWLKFDGNSTAEFEGSAGTSLEISLREGWNLVGTITDSSWVDQIDDPDDILVPGTTYGYDGSYQNTDAMAPGRGYFIKASEAGTVTLNVNYTSPVLKSEEPVTDNFDRLIVSNGHTSQTLLLGSHSDETLDMESFSLPPLPPDPLLDVRIEGDLRFSQADSIIIMLTSRTYPVTITYEPAHASTVIYVSGIDRNGSGRRMILEPGDPVLLNRPYERVAVWGRAAAADSKLPVRFALHPGYPNPFNPTTTIRYDLPSQAAVYLAVYDLLGRQVATLVDGRMSAGKHKVELDASSWSSGIYFVRIKAGTFEKVQKLTLIK